MLYCTLMVHCVPLYTNPVDVCAHRERMYRADLNFVKFFGTTAQHRCVANYVRICSVVLEPSGAETSWQMSRVISCIYEVEQQHTKTLYFQCGSSVLTDAISSPCPCSMYTSYTIAQLYLCWGIGHKPIYEVGEICAAACCVLKCFRIRITRIPRTMDGWEFRCTVADRCRNRSRCRNERSRSTENCRN